MDANRSTRPDDTPEFAPTATDVRHRPDERRYVVSIGDREVGFLDYSRLGRKILFTHTEVDPDERRAGIGGALVEAALDDVRGQGLLARPLCDFVAQWVGQHPDYLDIVDPVDRERLLVPD